MGRSFYRVTKLRLLAIAVPAECAAEVAACFPQVRRLKKVQKLSGALVVNARRNSLASPGGLGASAAASEAGSPMHGSTTAPSPLGPSRFASLDTEPLDNGDLEDLAQDEEFALSEQAHMCVCTLQHCHAGDTACDSKSIGMGQACQHPVRPALATASLHCRDVDALFVPSLPAR